MRSEESTWPGQHQSARSPQLNVAQLLEYLAASRAKLTATPPALVRESKIHRDLCPGQSRQARGQATSSKRSPAGQSISPTPQFAPSPFSATVQPDEHPAPLQRLSAGAALSASDCCRRYRGSCARFRDPCRTRATQNTPRSHPPRESSLLLDGH